MFHRLQAQWQELRHWPPGERFARFHRKHRESGSRWTKVLLVLAALASFAIGVVLAFIPGPAFVFFGLAGGLMATQSSWVATRLDRTELRIRRGLRWLKAKRAGRRFVRNAPPGRES
jgi:hypothetical protein